MKKPYVPKRTLSLQLPLEVYDKLEMLADLWNTTKTGALIRILMEVNGANEEQGV